MPSDPRRPRPPGEAPATGPAPDVEAGRAALVRRRRLWRRVKALGAIVLGLGAGTFLACHGAMRREAAPGAGEGEAGSERPGAAATGAPLDAGAADAGSPRDASPVVDVDEHRDGMPVRDNLLE